MKKITFFVIISAFIYMSLYSQIVDYYTGKTEVNGYNYRYIIETIYYENTGGHSIIISNSNNTKIGKNIILPNGQEVTNVFGTPWLSPQDKSKAVSIFKEVFTEDEISRFKERALSIEKKSPYDSGLYLLINYIVDMEGNILELNYQLENDPVLLSIYPDKLYQLEQKLKEHYKFVVPENYKVKYNYLTGVYSKIIFEKL
jgi:hypothetical protein